MELEQGNRQSIGDSNEREPRLTSAAHFFRSWTKPGGSPAAASKG